MAGVAPEVPVAGASYGARMDTTRTGGRPDTGMVLAAVTARDIPGCAWTLALAETSARHPLWRRKATAAATLGLYLALVVLEPNTYHRDRVLIVKISRQVTPRPAGPPSYAGPASSASS